MSRGSTCKLADFGVSASSQFIEEQKRAGEKAYLVGTAPYIAPEFLKGSWPTSRCDVYAFGVCLWQMLTKELSPYPNMADATIIEQVSSACSVLGYFTVFFRMILA